MNVPLWLWFTTLGVALLVLVLDVFVIGRRPHEPSIRESARYLVSYITAAGFFGCGVWFFSGGDYGAQFFAGWITEYSLSVDNLFVFLLIMSRFSVPRQYQQTALLVGIILALIFRGIFIALGAAAIAEFSWVFYLFGFFLVVTAIRLFREQGKGGDEFKENPVISFVTRRFPATNEYHGVRLMVALEGRRVITPMLIVLVALGTTDLLFALDSIPAIYGLTDEPYLVFMANIFALMGLRQLYFLIGGLLRRLIYLSAGLSFLLFFIGIKLIAEALHDNEVPFINSGEPVDWAPKFPIWFSLGVIFGTLVVTTVASLAHSRVHTPSSRPS
ncbi:MAG: TerC/Alx family metal homeostasis membrane protein [Actinomycetota bacterium]